MDTLNVVVIGGKGTAINIAEHIVDAQRRFSSPFIFKGFAIDDPGLGRSINGYPVLCGVREVHRLFADPSVRVIFSLYKPALMRERVELLQSLQIPLDRFTTFVHPSSYVGGSVRLGNGSVILANAAVHANVTVGPYCIFNAGVVVEHDTVVGASSYLAAGAIVGSSVRIGAGCFLGLKSSLRESTAIGDFAFVGMGANVLRDVDAGSVVFGNPALAKK